MVAGKHASWTPNITPTLERRWCGVSQSLCSVSCCKGWSQCCEKLLALHPGRLAADMMQAVYNQPCLSIAAVLDMHCMPVSTACHCSITHITATIALVKSMTVSATQHCHGLLSFYVQPTSCSNYITSTHIHTHRHRHIYRHIYDHIHRQIDDQLQPNIHTRLHPLTSGFCC